MGRAQWDTVGITMVTMLMDMDRWEVPNADGRWVNKADTVHMDQMAVDMVEAAMVVTVQMAATEEIGAMVDMDKTEVDMARMVLVNTEAALADSVKAALVRTARTEEDSGQIARMD